ncbi:adenosine deaminase [Lacticaseibacillus jixiensis]|uniref:adenosine deaminase n=1 Tax=Lacticaseibacillus jixiensis TaxID=3231926 RepID=UPI0036F20380
MDSLYHQLPKVELHCHLDGSLSLPVIRKLAANAHVTLPAADSALAALVQAPQNTASLLDYLRPFDVIRPLLQTKANLRMAAYDVAEQAAKENVRYLEVRFDPEFSMDEGLSVAETIQAVASGLHQAALTYDIQCGVLVCGMRQTDPARNAEILQAAAPLLGNSLCGADFAGNETDYPTAVLTDSIALAQQLHLPLTLHAGECHCVHNITQALAMGILRIGHATALFNEPAAIAQFVKAGATAELCLTSNLQTKAAQDLAHYPYDQLKQAGVKLTINTDNRTVSHTDLTHEYQLFAANFGTTIADFLAFNLNAAAACFQPAAIRTALASRLRQEYAPFLA